MTKIDIEKEELEKLIDNNPRAGLMTGFGTKKQEFEYLRKCKVEVLILWSKVNGCENGGKLTKYFCDLEKRHLVKKKITE